MSLLSRPFLPMEFIGFDPSYYYTVATPLMHLILMRKTEIVGKPHLAYL